MAGNEAGRIVLATTSQGVSAGALVERKGGRVSVVTETATRETWGEERVFRICEVRVSLQSAKSAAEGLRVFRAEVESCLGDVDIPGLWEILAEDGGPHSIDDLADLAFPASGPRERAAIAWALALDQDHFRSGTDGTATPLPREAVEAAERKRFRDDQERERLDRAVEGIRELIAGSGTPADGDPSVRVGLSWIRALALSGPGDKEGARGLALLEKLHGGPVSDPALAAFHSLVDLGIFHEDEILGVHRNRFRLEFPSEVLEEAAQLAAAGLPDDELRGRTVLDVPAGSAGPVAVDDPWTRDVDDALMVARLPDGAFRIHVLIADPCALVPLESAVGREGALRAATLYLPAGKVPMLPPNLSEGILSLVVGEVRPMLDFDCTLEADGSVRAFQVVPVLSTLARSLTYDEVDRILADPDDPTPMAADLATLGCLSEALARRRVEAGAVPLARDDFAVRVRDGQPMVVRLRFASPARRLVAEFMILVCTLAGRFARENGIPAVYRRQNPPDDKSVLAGYEPGNRAHAWRLLRSLRRAELTTQPDFHWGLGVVAYTQVTSPLRRFQDFVVHLQIKSFLRNGTPALDAERILRMFGDLESQAEALAQTEREAKRYWILKALAMRTGEEIDGEVVAVQGSRAHVELLDNGLLLPVAGLGHLAPGTGIRLRIREVDPRRDRVSLAPV
jgi:exoribonuclease-2